MDRQRWKEYFQIPEEDEFREGDAIAQVTKGITTTGYAHIKDGKPVAFYEIVETVRSDGGSFEWSKRNA